MSALRVNFWNRKSARRYRNTRGIHAFSSNQVFGGGQSAGSSSA
jgi:hypothetical protein